MEPLTKTIAGIPIQELGLPDMNQIVEDMRQAERNRRHREREEEMAARKMALADLAALPVEERLARIEAWIYDYRPQYVPPPRYR